MLRIERDQHDSEIGEERRSLEKLVSNWNNKSELLLAPLIAEAAKGAMAVDGFMRRLNPVEIDAEDADNEQALAEEEEEEEAAVRAAASQTAGNDDEDDEEGIDLTLDDTLERRAPPKKRKRSDKAAAPQKKRSELWNEVNNAVTILLPSSCMPNVRAQPCLKEAVDLEIALRRGEAGEALDALRTHLITSNLFKKEMKSKSARNTHAMKTRYKGRTQTKTDNVNRAAIRYRRAYNALRALGVEDDDNFRQLKQSDVRAWVVHHGAQKLGDSKATAQPSWIWLNLKFLDTDDVTKNFSEYKEACTYNYLRHSSGSLTGCDTAVKVHWFRTSANKSRWTEENRVVKREIQRTTRFFKYHQHDWLLSAEARDAEQKSGHASYARK